MLSYIILRLGLELLITRIRVTVHKDLRYCQLQPSLVVFLSTSDTDVKDGEKRAGAERTFRDTYSSQDSYDWVQSWT